MSFISKLFRKTDDEPAAPTAEASAAPDTAAPAGAEDEAQPGPDPDAQAPAEPAADAPAEPEWWETSAPPSAAPTPETAGDPETPATAAEPASHGTQPLDTAGAEQEAPAAPEPAGSQPGTAGAEQEAPEPAADEPGTRPLSNADLPALAALHSQRELSFAARRDIGRVRAINQDSIFALLTTLPRESNDLTLGLFIVADGMGGHHGGEVASRLAISTIAQHVLADLIVPALSDTATEALQPLIVAAVQAANRTIWEHAQTLGSDMGTTCTVALLLGHALYLGHVGDSRAYVATPTNLRQLTNDHSTVGRLIQVGQLDPAEAREHPLRSQLYRTVGQQPEVLVDFNYQQLGDATHLLLASDGLWGMLDDDVMHEVLLHHRWPQDACNELIARANLAGGDDNISAIVISLPMQT